MRRQAVYVVTRFLACVFAVAAFIFGAANSDAALITTGPIEWPVMGGGNGHFYALVMPDVQSDGVTWTDAKSLAEGTVFLGSPGHLATVTAAGENDFLRVNFSSLIRPNGPAFVGDAAWIGLSDAALEGNYQWVTGEPLAYSNWHFTEPNNIGGIEDYAHYWVRDGAFTWNDAANNVFGGFPGQLQGYFVEFDGPFVQPVPEPASCLAWATIAIVGCGWSCSRRRWLRIATR